MKKATDLNEQISLLRQRGMIISDEAKAKEVLMDIGYYRLGFYWFPYEKNFPNKVNRNHGFREGTKFEQAVNLYYFDLDLRNILSPYLYRIEVNTRTYIIYTVSNKYKEKPTWFADKKIVSEKFVSYLPKCYKTIQNNEVIKCHHSKYPNDIYAPAWKTLEFMSFGDILFLYSNLKDESLRQNVSEHYGVKRISIFEKYMNTIKLVRNQCAHGHDLYDLKLQKSLKAGIIKNASGEDFHNISGCMMVITYILGFISKNRTNEMNGHIIKLMGKQDGKEIDEAIRPVREYIRKSNF